MDTLLKRVALAGGVTFGLLLAVWLALSDPIGRGCASVRDTVVVTRWDTIAAPPCTIYVRTKPIIIVDTLFKERVDSLIANVDRDSLIRELSQPQTAQVPYRIVKDSVEVIGRITVDYFPLDRNLQVINQIDTLTLPRVTEYITTTQVVEVADPTVVVVSVIGGALCGAGLMWFLAGY